MKKILTVISATIVEAALFAATPHPSLAESIGCETGRLTVMSDESLRRIDDLFAKRIKAIEKTPNMSVADGVARRYLSAKGDDAADGLTPQTAWRTMWPVLLRKHLACLRSWA